MIIYYTRFIALDALAATKTEFVGLRDIKNRIVDVRVCSFYHRDMRCIADVLFRIIIVTQNRCDCIWGLLQEKIQHNRGLPTNRLSKYFQIFYRTDVKLMRTYKIISYHTYCRYSLVHRTVTRCDSGIRSQR